MNQMLKLVLLFVRVWIWRRRLHRRHAAIAQSRVCRRRLEEFIRRQEDVSILTMFATNESLSLTARQRRALWVRPRSRAFFFDIVMNWDDEEWKRNFRISRSTFRFLCAMLRHSLHCMEVVRRPLNVEQRVAITLWRLGTNLEYWSISHLFGVGLSTVCVVVHEVCTAIVHVLSRRYIRIPTGEDAQATVDVFRGCRRQPLYCFHLDFRCVTLVRYIYIYIYIYI